jgi:pimeloyl-ACP methyl ester carboxylesterase
MSGKLWGIIMTMIITASSVSAAPSEKPVSIVLVHGAFVDASGWQAVYDILSKDGYEVLMVQNPTVTLQSDVAATTRVIAKAKHPVILVGHSYGGAVITEAGDNAKVRSLVYLAAFAPDIGESVYQLATGPTEQGEEGPPLLPPQDGFLLVDPAKFPNAFAAGADPTTTHFMAAAQVPWGLDAVQTKTTVTAWRTKPTYFMITTQDRMIPTSIQRKMAARAQAKSTDIASSHAVMLTQPQKVAAFIIKAAESAE